MTPHILFKFASRSRPEKFFKALDNIMEMIEDKVNYTILCSLDEDDKSMTNHFMNMSDFTKWNLKYPNTKFVFGFSKNKIHAINRDIEKVRRWDILINTSDDMWFTVKGFDNIIRDAFEAKGFYKDNVNKHYNLNQFIHFNDGNQRANVSTMSIMGYNHYNQDQYIYNPAYKSVWCDVEATDHACIRGAYKYMGDDLIIFNHNHPAFGKSEYDAQYRASENLDVWGEDLKTIIKRKYENYGHAILHNAPKYTRQDVERWIVELNNARINAGKEPIQFT